MPVSGIIRSRIRLRLSLLAGEQCLKSVDREAREIIAQELGHRRTDVMASYISSCR